MTKQPSYRFGEYTEAWEQKKLGEVAEVNPKSVVPDEFKYVDLGAVVGTEMVSYRNETISTSPSRAQRLAIKGDVFYQTVRPYQKNNYLFKKDDNDYVFSTGYAQLRPSGDGCFLLSYLQTNKFVNVVLDNCTGTSYPAINSKDLSDIFISLPSLPEQTVIGSFFQDIDQLISLQQRKLEVLKEQKKTYLKLFFPAQGQTKPALRFAGFEDDWKEVKLGEIGETYTGLSGKTKEDFGHGEGKFITYVNVFNNPLTDLYGLDSVEIDDKQRRVQYGDVLFTTSSETPEDVGLSSVWMGTEDNVYLNSFCFGYRPQKGIFDLYYLAFVLRSFSVRREFMLLAQGISRFNISKTKVMDMAIHVPSLPEQEAIGSFFQDLDKAIAKQEEKVNQLKESKQTLLRKMFI